MQRRFHADPRVQAADLLLQERIPHLVPLKNPPIETGRSRAVGARGCRRRRARATRRRTRSARAPHLLSNGSYVVMVTNAGGGYSRRQQTRADALARGRHDRRLGQLLLRPRPRHRRRLVHGLPADRARAGRVRSAPSRPIARCSAASTPSIETRTEIVVSPEDDAELRRVSVTNHSRRHAQPRPHQLRRGRAGAGRCRPRAPGVQQPVHRDAQRAGARCADLRAAPALGHRPPRIWFTCSAAAAASASPTQFETDRARFIGRGGTLERPAALAGDDALSNTTGPVLDPIVSLRQTIRLPPGATARVAFTTGLCRQRRRRAPA